MTNEITIDQQRAIDRTNELRALAEAEILHALRLLQGSTGLAVDSISIIKEQRIGDRHPRVVSVKVELKL